MLEEFKKISIYRNKKVSILFLISGVVLYIPLVVSALKYMGQVSFKMFILTGYHFPYFLMAFVGVALWIIALLQTIKTYTGGYLRKLKEDVLKSGYSREAIDADFASALSCYSFRLGQLMLYFLEEHNKIARAYATKRILWAYYGDFPSTVNKGARKGIIIYVDGRQHPVELITPSYDKCSEYLKEIAVRYPWTVVDYSKELEDLYLNHRDKFKALRYNKEIAKV